MEWTPTSILKHDVWRKLLQLWVRIRRVETKSDADLITQEEVIDTEWRLVP
jgi:hypothetical protein